MDALLADGEWPVFWRTEKARAAKENRDPKPWKTIKAKDLWDQICYAAWACADPGIQFDTIINDWHTCPADGRINASNPCSEYMFLDDTACNLASINLMKFYDTGSGVSISNPIATRRACGPSRSRSRSRWPVSLRTDRAEVLPL